MLELLLKTKPTQEPTVKGLSSEGEGLKNGEKSDFFSMLLSIKNAKESKVSTSVESFKSLRTNDGALKDVISKELASKLGSSKDKVKFMLLGEKDSKPKEMTLKELFKLAKSKDLNLEKIEIVTEKDIKGESKEVKTSFDKNSIKSVLEGEISESKKAQKKSPNLAKKIDPELAQKLALKEEAEPKAKSSLKTLLASVHDEAKKSSPKDVEVSKNHTSLKVVDEKHSEKQDSKPASKNEQIKPENLKSEVKESIKAEAPKSEVKEPQKEEPVVDKKAQTKEPPKNEQIKPENLKSEVKESIKAEAPKSEVKERQKAEPVADKKVGQKEEVVDKKSSFRDEGVKESPKDSNKQELKQNTQEIKSEVKKDEPQRVDTPKPTQERTTSEAKKIDDTEPKKSYFEKDIPKEDRYAKAKEDERTTSRILNDEKVKVATPNEPRVNQNQKSDEGLKTSKETSFLEKLFAKSGEFDKDGDSEGRRDRKDESEQQQKSFVKDDSSEKSSGITSRFDFLSKSINAKETLRNLASNLQREAQNYKPPFKKITLELNPAKLGSIEVTMVTRGKNLHINIGSNAQAVALLSQNMVDFKNALNEIGFGEVSMNFNSGDNSQNNPNQGDGDGNKKRGNSNSLYTSSNSEEETNQSVEIVLPRYM